MEKKNNIIRIVFDPVSSKIKVFREVNSHEYEWSQSRARAVKLYPEVISKE